MQRSECLRACRALAAAALLIGATATAASGEPAPYRYQAPIVVDAERRSCSSRCPWQRTAGSSRTPA
jgi:hypothetical protein